MNQPSKLLTINLHKLTPAFPHSFNVPTCQHANVPDLDDDVLKWWRVKELKPHTSPRWSSSILRPPPVSRSSSLQQARCIQTLQGHNARALALADFNAD